MKCGDRGFVTAHGTPCKQTIGQSAAGCIWHTSSPEERSLLALKGGLTSRMKRSLPADYLVPEFADEDAVIAFAREMARKVLVTDVDPRRIDVALRAAAVALTGFNAKTTARMVAALESLEHGGAAMVLLSQMSERLGTGTKRALPGRAGTLLPFPSADCGDPDPAS